MLKQVWSLTREAKKNWSKIESVSYDYNGNIINPHSYPLNNNRPLVVFYAADDVYYLTSRSIRNNRQKQYSEVVLYNQRTNKYSYVETNNVHIMKREDFFSIFERDDIDELLDYNEADLNNLFGMLGNQLYSGTLHIQGLSKKDYWVFPNNDFKTMKAYQYLLHFDELISALNSLEFNKLREYATNLKDDEKWFEENCKNYVPLRKIKDWDLNECKYRLRNNDITKINYRPDYQNLYKDDWNYEQEEAEQQNKKDEQNKKEEDDLALSM